MKNFCCFQNLKKNFLYIKSAENLEYDKIFLKNIDKYCPEQFEIVGMAKRGAGDPALKSKVYTKYDYPNYSDLNATPTIKDASGVLHNTYPRILIRKKQ